jgi:hypothetical protein
MKRPRRTPYTAIGIRRVKCSMRGCRRKGYATWQVCADGRVFRALCWIHDIALNRLVLEWIDDPAIAQKMARYEASVIRKVAVL